MTQITLPSSSRPAQADLPAQQPGQTGTVKRPGLLGRLPVGRKIALASLLLAVPYLMVNYSLRDIVVTNLNLVNSQLVGQALLKPTAALMQNTQLVRLSSVNLLNGQAEAKAVNAEQRAAIDAAFGAMLALAQENSLTDLATDINKAQTELKLLHAQVDAASISAKDAQAAYSRYLIEYVQPMFAEIAQETQLHVSTNGTATSVELAQHIVPLVTDTLPLNLPNAGAIISGNIQLINRSGGVGQPISEATRTEAQLRWDTANEARQRILTGLRRAVEASPELEKQLKPAYTNLLNTSNPIFDKLSAGLLKPATIQVDPASLNALTPAYAQGLFGALSASIDTLGSALQAEKRFNQAAVIASNTVPPLILALFGFVFFLITRSITRPLKLLTDGSQRMTSGQLDLHLPVTTQDELGTLTTSFNSAAQQLRENAVRVEQERLEATKLQQHIGDFLDVTMDIAEGDLTKRGKVTDDVLGNVVDSINLMTDELAQVLKTVQSTSASVQGGSETMRLTTEQIQHGAQLTADETLRVAQRVQEITSAIRQMADSAQQSAQTARQALLASQQGQDAVENTLDGMQNIRRQVQSMSKRIKSLGDRSLEIQEIVDTLAQITDQTHLLALNASIEAAGAGEAGNRFSIVADSVRKLSLTSAEANNRIAALIRNVQAEVQDVIVSVEDNTREVEQGYRVAGQAGERLREISALTQQSAQLAESMADSTQAQVEGVDQVRGAVEQIAAVARDSQSSVQQGRQAAEQLQSLAHELNTNLARFKLPGEAQA